MRESGSRSSTGDGSALCLTWKGGREGRKGETSRPSCNVRLALSSQRHAKCGFAGSDLRGSSWLCGALPGPRPGPALRHVRCDDN